MEKIFEKPSEQYDNVADRTVAEMMGEHLEIAFDLLQQVRPEVKGFHALVIDSPDGESTKVEISLIEKEVMAH